MEQMDEVVFKLGVRAEKGKDTAAHNLLRKLAFSFALLTAKDFWAYTFEWLGEATNFLQNKVP